MSKSNKLPPLFHVNNTYKYFYQQVKYVGRDSEYYRFVSPGGGDLLISPGNVHLIFGERVCK